MASLQAIREALATTISNVIPASPLYVSQVNPPCAVIFPQPGQDVVFATLDGAVDYNLIAVLLVPYADEASAQQAMDALLDSGATASPTASVLAALHADPGLGGACDWAVPVAVSAYRLGPWGGQEYLRCDVAIQVAAHQQ